MSFFDPDITYNDGSTFKSRQYKEIIKEQVLISYACNGISFIDTDSLCPYDRKVIIQTIKEIKDEEKKQMDEAMK